MLAKRSFASLLAVIVLLLADRAHAAPDEPMANTARDLFNKAVKSAEQQKWSQCRAELLAAFGIKKHPQIAAKLARCEMMLGLYREAAEHLAYFLSVIPVADPRQESGEAELGRARQEIGTLQVVVDIPGAHVFVDDRLVGSVPLSLPLFVDPGRHTVEAHVEGMVPVRATVTLRAGETKEITLSKDEPKPVPPVPPSPPPPSTTRKPLPLWPVFALGAGALGGVALGAGLEVAANGKRSETDTLRSRLVSEGTSCKGTPLPSACSAVKDGARARDALSDAAIGSFVAGGVLGAAAVAYGLWAPPTATGDRASGLWVLPLVGASASGVQIVGAW